QGADLRELLAADALRSRHEQPALVLGIHRERALDLPAEEARGERQVLLARHDEDDLPMLETVLRAQRREALAAQHARDLARQADLRRLLDPAADQAGIRHLDQRVLHRLALALPRFLRAVVAAVALEEARQQLDEEHDADDAERIRDAVA